MMLEAAGGDETWANEEFGAAMLTDVRHNRRLVKMAVQLLEHPSASVHGSFRAERDAKAVRVREVESSCPAGEERLDWILYTTYPVNNSCDALEVARGYALRWRIERFHYATKTGPAIFPKVNFALSPRWRSGLHSMGPWPHVLNMFSTEFVRNPTFLPSKNSPRTRSRPPSSCTSEGTPRRGKSIWTCPRSVNSSSTSLRSVASRTRRKIRGPASSRSNEGWSMSLPHPPCSPLYASRVSCYMVGEMAALRRRFVGEGEVGASPYRGGGEALLRAARHSWIWSAERVLRTCSGESQPRRAIPMP